MLRGNGNIFWRLAGQVRRRSDGMRALATVPVSRALSIMPMPRMSAFGSHSGFPGARGSNRQASAIASMDKSSIDDSSRSITCRHQTRALRVVTLCRSFNISQKCMKNSDCYSLVREEICDLSARTTRLSRRNPSVFRYDFFVFVCLAYLRSFYAYRNKECPLRRMRQ